ncbi:restriction endonuclease subunit S [Phascolarctobacterium succinatutens]|uniref:restriction endonuclease subunit S n=1 Tax=Phascolarctobacterium succinatutens TaxID=626940 RepID=UPI003AB79E77
MPKKKTALTIEERLQQALVPAEEQPYEVPENWVWVRLGDVNKYISKSVNPISEPDKIFELYSVPSMVDNYPEIIAGSDIGSSKQSVCKKDVLLCKINPRINRVWKVSQFTDNELIASSEWIVIRNNHIDANYLMYCFQSKYFREFMLSNVSGVGGSLMRAQPKYVQTYPIPLPPLSEQQRIVERIEELFAKLDEAKERLQEVAESFAVRKAAILHKAFTGKLTKQWRRENGVSDESWEEKKGEDFFEYVTSGSRGWAKYYSDKGSIFVRMGNLNHGTIELDFSDIQYVELPDQVEGQRSKLQKNDILISITADVGMIGLVREDMDAYINQHVALARPKNDLYAEFLAWYFVSDVGLQQMQNKQRGATKIGLGLQDIRSIILKIPTLSEQHEIVRLIDDLLARERAAQQATEQALASIDLMKKSILARAFRGELGTNKASEASALELLKQVLAEN